MQAMTAQAMGRIRPGRVSFAPPATSHYAASGGVAHKINDLFALDACRRLLGAQIDDMVVGVLVTAHETLRLHAQESRFDALSIDPPMPGQPPFADTINGVSRVRMAVQVTQDGVYHFAGAWLRPHGLPSLRRHPSESNVRAMRKTLAAIDGTQRKGK